MGCGQRASSPGIASPASCRTCRKRSSRCWPPTSIGATWSSCSPDFGIRGVIDRFGQIAPKVLFTADGYCYGGKTLDSIERIAGILAEPAFGHVRGRRGERESTTGSRAGAGGTPLRRVWPTGRDAALRAPAFRSSALHSLFVGHHGRAEVHRPRRGRHAAAAPERAPVALGRASRATGCSSSRRAAG